jgi:hypothetical protein
LTHRPAILNPKAAICSTGKLEKRDRWSDLF